MKIIPIICTIILCFSYLGVAQSLHTESVKIEDFDPLVDINVTVDILSIRALDDIDGSDTPDFFVKIIINGEEFISNIWYDKNYVYEPNFSVTKNVPDDKEFVTVEIQLFDWNTAENYLCDIGDENNNDIMEYSIKYGNWMGDDQHKDKSGYGRLNGCDDGSIYENERDCEVLFNIYQNDYDDDTLPYWVELNGYETDPEVDNSGEDFDEDGLPIEYEHRWIYDPFSWDDHENIDEDGDSLTNYEEFLTKDFGTNPFRKDVLLEYDFMEAGPSGEENIVPIDSDDLLKNPFHRRNIVFHIKRDQMIPFDDDVSMDEVFEIYDRYYLDNDSNNWKRSVFHYGIFVHGCSPPGYGFSGDVSPYMGYIPGTNGLIISCRQMEKSSIRDSNTLAYTCGSAIMHEMGHNFGIRFGNPLGCDNRGCIYPWRLGFWLFWNYKSCMNYRYTYKIFDYSDGSHGKRDFDDWSEIDLTYFEIPEEKTTTNNILNKNIFYLLSV